MSIRILKRLLDCGCGDSMGDLAPLVLRVVTGAIFLVHGIQQCSWGQDAVAAFLGGLGFPSPGLFALLLIGAEIFGGGLLILGLFTHWAAKLASIVALTALLTVHLKNGFFMFSNVEQGGGYEFIILILGATISLGLTGAGKWSLDRVLLKKFASEGLE